MNLNSLPADEFDRLDYYQRNRAIDEERRRVAEIRFKQDLGHPLTRQEETYLAYSPFGSTSTCGY